MTESVKDQVKAAMDELVAQSEVDRLAGIRAEVEAAEKARLEARDPLKIGERRYRTVGSTNGLVYVIIGSPRVKGERWLTVAPEDGGLTASYPESQFLNHFWEPNG